MTLITIGVILMLGYYGFRGNDEPQGVDIVRRSGESVSFQSLGISVAPSDGWTLLATAKDHKARRVTYVCESSNLIVRIRPFLFKQWPPLKSEVDLSKLNQDESQTLEQTGDADTTPTGSDTPLLDADVVTRRYDQVAIDWLDPNDPIFRHTSRLYGRMNDGDIDLLVEVWTHGKNEDFDPALTRLCDALSFQTPLP